MTTLSQPSAGPSTTPTALAAEWILLNSGCEDLMSYDEWCDRRAAAVAYADTWSMPERTEFWYALADQACTEPLLAPTPDLDMTAENMAREDRRLQAVVQDLDDGQSEFPPYNWLRFTDPMHYGFTFGESIRYGIERSGLAWRSAGRPLPSTEIDDVKIIDLLSAEGPA